MKSNKKGFTLIELIISISISVLVLATVATLLWQSTNYYRRTKEEILLQMEAQTILNQLKDLTVEAENVKFENTTEPSILKIQHDRDLLYEIIFSYTDKTLTFVKVIKEEDASISRTEPQLFGKYVEEFHVIDRILEHNSVKISFILKGEFSTYEIDESLINLRNQVKPMQPYW